MEKAIQTPVVGMVSLGCPKNLVESETLLAEMAGAGFIITGDHRIADVLVVNTCGFLKSARAEASEIIDDLVSYKSSHGRCRCLVVMGCWAQIDSQMIMKKWKGVDVVVGVNDRCKIIDRVIACLEQPHRITETAGRILSMKNEGERFRLTPAHWCYLRISEGCSQRCTFCRIPAIRGPYRSKPMQEILDEAEMMIDSGAKEIILIGQETTNYGNDLGLKDGLSKLLHKLNALRGVNWIRLMYTYPANFSDQTIFAIRDLEHVVKYIDIPLQHISDSVLRKMGRRIDRYQTERLLEKLKTNIPSLAIRTTMIVGFPGEGRKEFSELMDFVRTWRFDALGAFMFSPEPTTAAASFKPQVSNSVKLERLDELMRMQKTIAHEKAEELIGKRFEVYVEANPDHRKVLITRNSLQAPQIDSVTLVSKAGISAKKTTPGARLWVECTGVRGYDLVAKIIKK